MRSSELNIRLRGELSLEKPRAGLFALSGRVESKEGWVIFQGKTFQLVRGVFDFYGAPVIDPDMEILAKYKRREYTAYIKIGGTLYNPSLEIYSEPALEQADVLSVILFAKPVSQLTSGQRQSLASTGQDLASEYAASRLASSGT